MCYLLVAYVYNNMIQIACLEVTLALCSFDVLIAVLVLKFQYHMTERRHPYLIKNIFVLMHILWHFGLQWPTIIPGTSL